MFLILIRLINKDHNALLAFINYNICLLYGSLPNPERTSRLTQKVWTGVL